MSNLATRLFPVTVWILTLCWFASAQEPVVVSPGLNEAYLAKDDGSGHAGERTAAFRTTDVPIHCVVNLAEDNPQRVKINFIAVKVSGIKSETTVVTSAYDTTAGQTRVSFTGRPYLKWTPGVYRVDVFVEGSMVRSLEMTVDSPTSSAAARYLPSGMGKKLPRKSGKPNKSSGSRIDQ